MDYGRLYSTATKALNTQLEINEEQAKRIAELEAELEKHRWIPVSERLPGKKEKGKLMMFLHIDKKLRRRLLLWSNTESDIRSLRDSHTHWKLVVLP